MEQFPSNSYKSKKLATEQTTVKVDNKKKNGSEIEIFLKHFFESDKDSIADCIMNDIFIPRFLDMVHAAWEFVGNRLFGQYSVPRGASTTVKTSYHNRYRTQSSFTSPAPTFTYAKTYSVQFEKLLFQTREDANIVLEHLCEDLRDYGHSTVASYYEWGGHTPGLSNYNWNNYGWTDLGNVEIKATVEGFYIDLPNPKPV